MDEQPNYNVKLKCVWNKQRVISDTSLYSINIELNTSINKEAMVGFLEQTLKNLLVKVSNQSNADEKLISIR